MKQRKQNYITLSADGKVLAPQAADSEPALDSVPEAADVAYRIARAAEEAAAALPLAPNAMDAADMSEYTDVAVGRSASSGDVASPSSW